MNNFKFNNPWLLFLIIPLVVLIVVGFFMMKKEKRYTKKNIISFSLHLVIAVLISVAFADPSYLTVDKETDVYILVDASASEKTSTDRIDQAIKDVRAAALETPNTKVGVIPFAKEAKTLVELGGSFNSINDIYNDESFDYTATNLEEALLYTAEKFDSDSYKRIVLISDGNETDGEAINTIETLMQEGITVDVINLKADFPVEISLTGINYTDNTYLNRDESVEALINASAPSNVTLELYKDGSLIASQNAYLGAGLNVVSFPLDTSSSGEFKYEVKIKEQDGSKFNDTFIENNTRSFVQNVSGDFEILFLGKTNAELNKFKELASLPEEATIDSYINEETVPYTLEDLIKYDEIILSDIDLTTLDNYADFITNLSTAVSVYGKSVFTFDATYVGNTNDPALVLYNDLLPVQYQPDDSRALVLVIDSSGSMGGNNLDMAIQGAKEVVDKLDVNDSIAVVTFETNVTVPVTMTTIRNEENRQDIKDKIDRITNNGGTNMLNGLDEAFKQIQGVTAEYKDIITLTDGLAGDDIDDLKKYVTSMSFSNISCSFINILDKEGEELLRTLAKLGNGQYHYVDSALGLKDIMVDAIEEEIIDTVIEKDSPVIYQIEDDPSLEGGVYNNLENVLGYNYCRMKSGANTVLSVQYIHTNSENQLSVIAIPLYAYWEFGAGKVSSFTSSLSTDWTSKFWSAASGKTFFKNIVNQSLPDRYNKSVLNVEFKANGSTSEIEVSPNVDTKNSKVSVELKSLEDESTIANYDLVYDGSSFTYNLPTPNVGFYEAKINFSKLNSETNEYEVVETTTVVYSFDYSSEFNFFDETENTLLNQIASQCGGSILAENNIHIDMSNNQLADSSYVSLMVWILLAAVIVYLADITIRKSIFRKKEKKEVSEPADNYF